MSCGQVILFFIETFELVLVAGFVFVITNDLHILLYIAAASSSTLDVIYLQGNALGVAFINDDSYAVSDDDTKQE